MAGRDTVEPLGDLADFGRRRRRHGRAPMGIARGVVGGRGRRGAHRLLAHLRGRRRRGRPSGIRRLSLPRRNDAPVRTRSPREALRLARGYAVAHSRGSPRRLFTLVYVVGILVTVLLSNDATAVVLTPAVYAATRHAGTRPLPYLLICAFIANAASFVLPISNPANLVVFGAHLPPLATWLEEFSARLRRLHRAHIPRPSMDATLRLEGAHRSLRRRRWYSPPGEGSLRPASPQPPRCSSSHRRSSGRSACLRFSRARPPPSRSG